MTASAALGPGGTPFDQVHSYLFAPGDDEHKLALALDSSAHAVIADLEDAVASTAKARARAVVASVFCAASPGRLRIVRVNAIDTPYFAEDLALASQLPIDGILVPKATAESLERLGPDGPPVLALLETAAGVQDSAVITRLDRVHAVVLGSIDLAAEVGMRPRADGLELLYARSKLVIDSAAAGIAAPVDIVHTAFRDAAGLAAEAGLARSLGMGGKLCIHPAQVNVVNTVFAPTPAEIEAAHKLIAAYELSLQSGRGVAGIDGEMIDLALVRKAKRLLASIRDLP